MGTSGTDIGESDTYLDVYEEFFIAYNDGASPEKATKRVRDQMAEYFTDADDQYDAHFALALAQWETQSLEASLLKKVADYIESGADVNNWRERDATESDIKKRRAALDRFLTKLRKPRASKKRRRKQEYNFSQRILIELRAPDDKKTFSIAESYTNEEYAQTLAMMHWTNGGGRVFSCTQAGLHYSAKWIDAQNLEIDIPSSVEAELRRDRLINLEQTGFFGDLVHLHCRFV